MEDIGRIMPRIYATLDNKQAGFQSPQQKVYAIFFQEN
jgi:hypothetical protein